MKKGERSGILSRWNTRNRNSHLNASHEQEEKEVDGMAPDREETSLDEPVVVTRACQRFSPLKNQTNPW